MAYDRPFHRNFRELVSDTNSGYSSRGYILDKEYAQSPEHYIRAFVLIQNDLKKLFEYIEPDDNNFLTYSYRIHELFIRTCIEIEANFKAILKENIYSPKDKSAKIRKENTWNIFDFNKIEITHHLSSYKVLVPIWNGNHSVFQPFKEWKDKTSLSWYTAYNRSKHNRQSEFSQANFNNLINAITGLLIVLSSQFGRQDFSPSDPLYSSGSNGYYSFELAIGGFFRIEFPNDWEETEKYHFNWGELRNEEIRFNKIDYNEI